MKSDLIIKQETIVETALKRMSHFGIAKTTFADIARDMGVTQQNLYYYFPDKKSLIKAVMNEVIEEYLARLTVVLSEKSPLCKKLKEMVEVKEEFFEKYHMMMMDHHHEIFYGNDELHHLMESTNKRQQKLVVNEVQKAVDAKEIGKVNVRKVAELLLNVITAMQESLRLHTAMPDKQSIRNVFQQQKELISIYVDGLKYATCNS